MSSLSGSDDGTLKTFVFLHFIHLLYILEEHSVSETEPLSFLKLKDGHEPEDGNRSNF
jgi:hypothetical protein